MSSEISNREAFRSLVMENQAAFSQAVTPLREKSNIEQRKIGLALGGGGLFYSLEKNELDFSFDAQMSVEELKKLARVSRTMLCQDIIFKISSDEKIAYKAMEHVRAKLAKEEPSTTINTLNFEKILTVFSSGFMRSESQKTEHRKEKQIERLNRDKQKIQQELQKTPTSNFKPQELIPLIEAIPDNSSRVTDKKALLKRMIESSDDLGTMHLFPQGAFDNMPIQDQLLLDFLKAIKLGSSAEYQQQREVKMRMLEEIEAELKKLI